MNGPTAFQSGRPMRLWAAMEAPLTDTAIRPDEDTPQGLALAGSAYILWGLLPLYLKLVSHLPVTEVLTHRVIWAFPIAGAVLVASRRTVDLRTALADRRTLLMAGLTALLLSVNWGIYVYAIATDRALDAALGYYVNPLFSMMLGAILLGERLRGSQLIAVGLAALAVLILFLDAARPPWIALGLTGSWGIYAYFKKSLPVGPNQGFFLEVLMLLPIAVIYLGWLTAQGESHFLATGTDTLLLLGCGLVTAVPLLFYANGAKLLRLSTIAILQYIVPTMVFAIAVTLFDEVMGRARMVAFPLIWAALVIYTVPLVRRMRRPPR